MVSAAHAKSIHNGKREEQQEIMTGKLQQFSPATLKALAGDRSYARGVSYFETGAVMDLIDTGAAIKAIVRGNDDYHVTLRVQGRRLDYDCDCPVGESGACCKHVVAVGLAWQAQQQGAEVSHTGTGRDEWQTIRDYLYTLDQEKLVELLLAQAEDDPTLRNDLHIQAARRKHGGDIDIKALKQIINKAISVRGVVDYYGMRRFLQKAQPVAQMLNDLWREKEAAAVAELAEHALLKGFKSYERTDDSDGGFGMLLGEIAGLYIKALPQAGIDPAALGKRLFALQMHDQWGFFHFDDYAPRLGEAGLAVFREQAQRAWREVPKGRQKDDGELYYKHYTITAIMEAIARHDGDLDALIAIKSRDLGSSHRYLEIAELLQKAKRHDEALAWAERGRKAFPDRLDVPLLDFLIAQYHKRKRHIEAMQLAWDHFTAHPSLNAYQRLQASAKYTETANTWRDKALAYLREAIKKQAMQKPASRFAWHLGYNNVLIEIHLAEGDSGKALQVARERGCPDTLWLQIAAACEADHPQDAIEIYQKIIDHFVGQTNNDAYDRAAELVKKVQRLMQHLKHKKEFDAYIEQLRMKFKAKRNFIKLLAKFKPASKEK